MTLTELLIVSCAIYAVAIALPSSLEWVVYRLNMLFWED